MKAKPIAPAPLLKRPVKPEEPKKPELFAQLLEQKAPVIALPPVDLPVEETAPPPPTNTVERITALATDRSVVGSNVSVLNSYSEQLGVLKDNLIAANSRIKDVDVAEESTMFAKSNILVQAGTAMLAQANAVPQSVLKLIG